MRLFVAIDVNDATRAQLSRVQQSLESELSRAPAPPRVTWVAPQSAHVTLRFIGEVGESAAERVRQALVAPIPHAPFDVTFSGLGAFPRARRPSVVWLGMTGGQSECAAIARLVNLRLADIVDMPPDRPFLAHLTVARVKEPGRFDWDAAFGRVVAGMTMSPIDHVTLYQSRTSPKGPTYTALCTTVLSR